MPFLALKGDVKNAVEAKNKNVLLVNVQTEIAGRTITEEWIESVNDIIPLWRGYLEGSGTSVLINTNPVTMNVIYDAVNRRNNYHYGLIQDDVSYQIAAFGHPFHHPVFGRQSPYLEPGIEKVDTIGLYAGFIYQVIGD